MVKLPKPGIKNPLKRVKSPFKKKLVGNEVSFYPLWLYEDYQANEKLPKMYEGLGWVAEQVKKYNRWHEEDMRHYDEALRKYNEAELSKERLFGKFAKKNEEPKKPEPYTFHLRIEDEQTRSAFDYALKNPQEASRKLMEIYESKKVSPVKRALLGASAMVLFSGAVEKLRGYLGNDWIPGQVNSYLGQVSDNVYEQGKFVAEHLPQFQDFLSSHVPSYSDYSNDVSACATLFASFLLLFFAAGQLSNYSLSKKTGSLRDVPKYLMQVNVVDR